VLQPALIFSERGLKHRATLEPVLRAPWDHFVQDV
jgi:hypothetical protein